jgi:sporulation protein YlmC with PRC-barrel domain
MTTTTRHQPRLATVEMGAGVLAAEDVRGYEVRDIDDRALGRVDDLIIDTDAGRVRFLKVGGGGILGLGRVHRLVPVDLIRGIAGEFVFLNATKDLIDFAPKWRSIDDVAYVKDSLRYFGTQPFWTEGYVAPDWTTPD